MLSFYLVFYFLGKAYPLQIRRKKTNNSCVANSSEAAATFNSRKQAST